MEVSVDRFGRILIPKSIREKLGLLPASRLVLEADDHLITLEPSKATSQLERNTDGIPVLSGKADMPIEDPIALAREKRALPHAG
ncbi:MAG: AbrB/MazE/SpoVT family DNA-binding domain-containing protein [Fimbriimonadaceae bacterium]